LIDDKGNIATTHNQIVRFELERLLKRAKEKSYEGKITELSDNLYTLFEKDKSQNLGEFVQLLEIIDFLHRHVNSTKPISQPKKELA